MEYSIVAVVFAFSLKCDAACNSSVWAFDRYYNNTEIDGFLNYLSATCDHPTEIHQVGKSYENRTLRAIQIGNQANNKNIWVDGGIHAREWIGHVTAMYIACQLCNKTDLNNSQLLSRWNWFVMPVVNPDGYEYTWTTDRHWRKTRKPNPGSNCTGTDPNRNFNYQWGVSGYVNNTCDLNYPGANANSEPEVVSVSDFVIGRKGSWDAFLNLHSAMVCWIPPWGYTTAMPLDSEKMDRAGKAAVEAMRNRHGINYTYYRTKDNSGTAKDWAYGAAGITYSYTVELRTSDNYTTRHELPPDQIIPTGEETLDAILALTREISVIEYSSSASGQAWSMAAVVLSFLAFIFRN